MDLVSAESLGQMLAGSNVPLVILEACRSGTVGKTDVFGAVAPSLIRAGVNSVLSMSHSIHVETTKLLVERFYRELARGETIGRAVSHARGALISSPFRWIEYGPNGRSISLEDWFLPQLYQRGGDAPLVVRDLSQGQQVKEFDIFLSHKGGESARIEILARLLSEKHGLRVWLDKWECQPGPPKPQCEIGVRNSRFTAVIVAEKSLKSGWVDWQIHKHQASNASNDRLVLLQFKRGSVPASLAKYCSIDFTDASKDDVNAASVARTTSN